MNKLLVSDILNLNSGSYNLDFNTQEAIINIKEDVTIYILNNKSLNKLTINLEENSILKLYKFVKVIDNNVNVIINQNNNSKLYYNATFINKENVVLKIDNYIKGNNNESNINIRNISNNNLSKIKINVDVTKNTINNIALEDIKGINNGGYIQIEPNIICETNEVVANHLTTIGTTDKYLIQYLMSKGINKENAKKIILKGFILSNMDNNFIDLIGGEFDV